MFQQYTYGNYIAIDSFLSVGQDDQVLSILIGTMTNGGNEYGQIPEVQPFIYGIKPAIIAVIVSTMITLGQKALKSVTLGIIGGLAAIDNMFSDLNIRDLKALDIGFGIGGVAFYLAEKYKMKVTGIEIYPWMVEYARTHTPISLLNSLEFHTYNNNGSLPYDPETFDLVYSKGVLNHVADKVSLMKLSFFHRWLRIGEHCLVDKGLIQRFCCGREFSKLLLY